MCAQTLLPGRVEPSQLIAIDADYAAQNEPVVDPQLTMALGEERLQPFVLFAHPPEKIIMKPPPVWERETH